MYQSTQIIGNLGRDPEMRYMPDGTAVTSFSVAVNKRWTDRSTNEKREQTTWFRVSVWGRQAEACNQYLHKGSQVFVEGTLQSDPATGGPPTFMRKDGTAGATFELRASTVRFLAGGQPDETEEVEEDDAPF